LKLHSSFQEELDWSGLVIQTVFPDQQTFVAFLKSAHTARHFLPTNFRLPNRPADFVLSRSTPLPPGVDMSRPGKSYGIDNSHEWILQEKVQYAEFVPTRRP